MSSEHGSVHESVQCSKRALRGELSLPGLTGSGPMPMHLNSTSLVAIIDVDSEAVAYLSTSAAEGRRLNACALPQWLWHCHGMPVPMRIQVVTLQ